MSTRLLFESFQTEGDLGDRRLVPPLDRLGPSELAVLRWLRWRFNEQTGRCDPSDVDIAAGTGLSGRTVRRARESLKAAGLIDWTGTRKGGHRGSNAYVLNLPDDNQPDTMSVSQPDATSGSDAHQPDTVAAPTGQRCPDLPATQPDTVAGEQHRTTQEEQKEEKERNPLPNPTPAGKGNSKAEQRAAQAKAKRKREERRDREQLLSDLRAQLQRKGDDPRTAAAIADLEAELGDGTAEDAEAVPLMSGEDEADIERIAQKLGVAL